jgi:hypothetical protein
MTLKYPFDGKGFMNIANFIVNKVINNIICEYKTDDNKICKYSEPLKNLVLQMLQKVLNFYFIYFIFLMIYLCINIKIPEKRVSICDLIVNPMIMDYIKKNKMFSSINSEKLEEIKRNVDEKKENGMSRKLIYIFLFHFSFVRGYKNSSLFSVLYWNSPILRTKFQDD